jgi:hypothetical protein
MRNTMMQFPLTLTTILEHAGRLNKDFEIVSRMPDKSLHRDSFGNFSRRERLLAEALQKAGLKRGDRVGTLMWNHYAHMEAYFGIPAAAGERTLEGGDHRIFVGRVLQTRVFERRPQCTGAGGTCHWQVGKPFSLRVPRSRANTSRRSFI